MEKSDFLGWETIETASRDDLIDLQLERLGQTLKLTRENDPHFRRIFDKGWSQTRVNQ